MAEEFQRVETETRLGRPTDEALQAMAERLASKNFEFVVLAVNIQRQVGGSLADILDMVADTVRGREQFARKVKALTAMGRASAYVLVGMPFFLVRASSGDRPPLRAAALGADARATSWSLVGLVSMALGGARLPQDRQLQVLRPRCCSSSQSSPSRPRSTWSSTRSPSGRSRSPSRSPAPAATAARRVRESELRATSRTA